MHHILGRLSVDSLPFFWNRSSPAISAFGRMPAPPLRTRLEKSGPALRPHQFIRKRSARTILGQGSKVQAGMESRLGRCRSRGDRDRSCSAEVGPELYFTSVGIKWE